MPLSVEASAPEALSCSEMDLLISVSAPVSVPEVFSGPEIGSSTLVVALASTPEDFSLPDSTPLAAWIVCKSFKSPLTDTNFGWRCTVTPNPRFLLTTSQISHYANSLPCRNRPPVLSRSVVLQLHLSLIVLFEPRVLANRQVNDILSRRRIHCSVAGRGQFFLGKSQKDAGHMQ